jgi:hypothetical protein
MRIVTIFPSPYMDLPSPTFDITTELDALRTNYNIHAITHSIVSYFPNGPLPIGTFVDERTRSQRLFFIAGHYQVGVIMRCDITLLDSILLVCDPDFYADDHIYMTAFPCCHPICYFGLTAYDHFNVQ